MERSRCEVGVKSAGFSAFRAERAKSWIVPKEGLALEMSMLVQRWWLLGIHSTTFSGYELRLEVMRYYVQ